MEQKLRILILEDSVDDVELLEHQLKKDGILFESLVVENREDYKKALEEFDTDVVISDHSLPQFDSLAALEIFQSYKSTSNPAAAFILVTGTVSEEFAVQIMKSGADDYILKDRLKRLPAAVVNAVEKNRLKDQRRREEEQKLYLFDILQRSLHETYVVDPRTYCFEYANEEALDNLGYTLKEMKRMTPAETLWQFDKELFSKAVNHAMNSPKGAIFDRYAVRKDGSRYPAQIHMQLIEHGSRKKILANVLDLTEAKELEQQRELGLFIQNAFQHTRDLHESLEIILAKLCDLMKCPAAEVYAKEFEGVRAKCIGYHNAVGSGRSRTARGIAEKVYEDGRTYDCDDFRSAIVKEDESWLQQAMITGANAFPIQLGEEIIAVMVCFRAERTPKEDVLKTFSEYILSKLAANIQRKKSEEELQKIFHFSPDILMVIGKDGYVRKVNAALTKILGYTKEEILSMNIEAIVHPDDLHELERWRNSRLKDHEVAMYESRILSKNGEYKSFAWSLTPYLKGELSFAVGKDITEMKKQVHAIQDQNQRLAEIAWEQSHVVRAPLTRLLACVEYLEETNDAPNDILASVKTSAYEIDEIIKRIINKSEKIELYGNS